MIVKIKTGQSRRYVKTPVTRKFSEARDPQSLVWGGGGHQIFRSLYRFFVWSRDVVAKQIQRQTYIQANIVILDVPPCGFEKTTVWFYYSFF